MATATHPTKEQVRAWQQERVTSRAQGSETPVQSPEEIRRQLGWGLMQPSTGGR